MNLRTMGLALILGGSLAFTSLACVEESPSILLNGSFALTGEVMNAGTEEAPVNILQCGEMPGDVTSGNFWSKGQINIADLKSCGQHCGFEGAFAPGGAPNTFTFIGGAENLLSDSRTTSGRTAQQGYIDQNRIWVQEAIITFSSENNVIITSDGTFEFPHFEVVRQMSAHLSSGGGTYFGGIDIVANVSELGYFESFLRERVRLLERPVPFVAEIQLRGKTQSGTKVESNKIKFPIDICVNCEMATTPICVPTA